MFSKTHCINFELLKGFEDELAYLSSQNVKFPIPTHLVSSFRTLVYITSLVLSSSVVDVLIEQSGLIFS